MTPQPSWHSFFRFAPSRATFFWELVFPERLACSGRRRPLASSVSVPKTAVDENRLLARGETDIRRSGKAASVQAKTVAEPVKEPPYRQFRRGICRTDACHVGPALGRRTRFSTSEAKFLFGAVGHTSSSGLHCCRSKRFSERDGDRVPDPSGNEVLRA